MTVVIASQLHESFNSTLRALPSAPNVFHFAEGDVFRAASVADVLLICPSSAWLALRDDKQSRPDCWPGRARWICTTSAGVDAYPEWLLDAPVVTCGRGVTSEDVADYAMAAIYLYAKDLEAHRARSPDQWRPVALGRVAGSTIGIIGMGTIGAAIARRALASGAKVTAVRRRALPSPIEGVQMLDTLSGVVASADHLIIALPATSETRHILDAKLLADAKPNAHLINVSRGSVIDQDALVAALDSDRLAFATLDVTDPEPLPSMHPLWRHPKVRLTPHLSALSPDMREVLMCKIATNLDRFISGQPLFDTVDVAAGY